MTTGQLHDALAEMGGALLLETLEQWMNGQITPMAQNHGEATYSPMISRETGRVDWTHHAHVIHNHIRGTTPYPGAFTVFGDERIKLFASEVLTHEGHGTPGEILTMDRHGMTVQTGEGILRIGEIQLSGKKRMRVEAFLLGNDSLVGSHLGR
jgi:methionyl-tRNA formyltransferase